MTVETKAPVDGRSDSAKTADADTFMMMISTSIGMERRRRSRVAGLLAESLNVLRTIGELVMCCELMPSDGVKLEKIRYN